MGFEKSSPGRDWKWANSSGGGDRSRPAGNSPRDQGAASDWAGGHKYIYRIWGGHRYKNKVGTHTNTGYEVVTNTYRGQELGTNTNIGHEQALKDRFTVLCWYKTKIRKLPSISLVWSGWLNQNNHIQSTSLGAVGSGAFGISPLLLFRTSKSCQKIF